MARKRTGVNANLIRQLNVARVFHALREAPGSSQREVAEATGLDAATVSAVAADLRRDGLLIGRRRPGGGRGRPETELRIDPRAGTLVGARLEPSGLGLVAATLAGERLGAAAHAAPASAEGPAAVVERLAVAVEELLAGLGRDPAGVRGIGVAVPALLARDGRLALAPNLGWRDVPLGALLKDRFEAPVRVDNDTKAACLAEVLFGGEREARDLLFLAGHSGVGGALYLGGRLHRGARGFAGEIGHVKVEPGGRACACGGRGCLEAYLGEGALLARAAEAGLYAADLDALARAADLGDVRVLAPLAEAGEMLGRACATLANLLDVERIVVGGAVARVLPWTLDAARAALARDALAPGALPALEPSALGTDSVPMGGVALALEGFLGMPAWLAADELEDLAPAPAAPGTAPPPVLAGGADGDAAG